MEPQIKNIASALVKAQRAFGPALKSSTNPHFRSRYADLSACVEAVIGGLNENGIALLQQTHDCEHGVAVETIFLHESGEILSAGKFSVPASKQDAQGYGSALTYARRYSLMAACGIAPEDDDGNAASRPRQEPPKAIKPKQEAPSEPIKEKVDAPVEIWWNAEVEKQIIQAGEDIVNQYLVKKDKIKSGRTWMDIEDETYRSNLVAKTSKFIEAVIKAQQ